MKLLTETIDVNEVNQLRLLLESNGIPVFISNEDAARNFGLVYPARNYGIFVVFDEQVEDALKLMADDSHVVKDPVDMEEYRQHMASSSPEVLRKLVKVGLLGGFFFVALFIFILVFLY